MIKNLTYDGQGPDAFFVGGTATNSPSDRGVNVVLPYPFKGKHFSYKEK